MAWNREQTWTPLDGGDLGHRRPALKESFSTVNSDTSYHGISSTENDRFDEDSFSPDQEGGYNMSHLDQNSRQSQASLLQHKNPLIQESSQEPPLFRGLDPTTLRFWKNIPGWKGGVFFCSITAVTVCLLNIILTIWACTNHKVIDGISYLYTGSCTEVASMSLWLHLGINVMSTLLLSASNYTMQILSSPNRKEVDLAHKKRKWLDIGVPSIRNLGSISRWRIAMWAGLGLSSIPLHLMYNTAIFSSLSANAYRFTVVTENFLTPSAVYNVTQMYSIYWETAQDQSAFDTMHEKALNGSLKNYEATDCMAAYATPYVSKHRNVLLVSTDVNATNNLLASDRWYDATIPYSWICGDSYDSSPYSYDPHKPACTLSIAQANVSNWRVSNHPISHCLLEETVEQCRLSFSITIMSIVIIANVIKASIMIFAFIRLRDPTLVTLGDAIASFLEEPDPTTVNSCLTTKQDILKQQTNPYGSYGTQHAQRLERAGPERKGPGGWSHRAKRWIPQKNFWFKAASIKRWVTCNFLCIFFIILGSVLLKQGEDNINTYDLKTLYSMGFGTVSSDAVLGFDLPGLISTTLLANLPQAILSFLYLTYNGLFTCVLGAYEWSLFGKSEKRRLRVTAPVGAQRSTYYLSLPYEYSIPLLILSGSLHWLMSQSLFLAYVTVFDSTGAEDANNSFSKVGYSCIAIVFAIIVGTVAVAMGLINGFRRYDDGMPLVGSCSAAISAACHRPPEDLHAARSMVSWGVVSRDEQTGIGHCCFSSLDVTAPEKEGLYAGMEKNR